MAARQSIEERFWSKVDKSAGPGGCWLWKAATKSGYGAFCSGARMEKAHRFVWRLTKGPIPVGVGAHGTCVCHRCDTPLCVNPAHLFLGTNAENVADRNRKGRTVNPRGSKHGRAKLTEADAVAILFDSRYQREIAADYGVHQRQISRIKRGQLWTHVTAAYLTRQAGQP